MSLSRCPTSFLHTEPFVISLCWLRSTKYIDFGPQSTVSGQQHFLFESVFSSGVADRWRSENEGLFSRERTLFKIRSYKHLTDDGRKCRNPCKITIVRSDTQAVKRKCQFFRSSLSVRRYRKAKNYPSPCQYSHSPLKVAREYKIW